MQPKVLFTASTCSHILNFHLPYLRRFREAGWQVQVACRDAAGASAYADVVWELPFKKNLLSAANFRAAGIIRRKIKAENYQLITTHTSLAAFFTRFALWGMRRRPPLVNMVHGYLFDDDTSFLKRQMYLWAERLTAGQTDLLLTMNRGDYELACRYQLGRRIAKVPGVGVDFDRFAGAELAAAGQRLRERLGLCEEQLLVVYGAEFSGRKSQQVLVQALTMLPERFVLALPGQGGLWQECQKQAAALGLGGRILLPGQVQDMPVWLAAADIAASSSRSEGLPFNIMEAMYAGLPVVASAVRGHVDLLEDEVSGLLYPYGDAGACAACLSRLEDRNLRRSLGMEAQKRVQKYDLDQVLPQVWRQYMSLVEVQNEVYNNKEKK